VFIPDQPLKFRPGSNVVKHFMAVIYYVCVTTVFIPGKPLKLWLEPNVIILIILAVIYKYFMIRQCLSLASLDPKL
jgi:hypothetical protein